MKKKTLDDELFIPKKKHVFIKLIAILLIIGLFLGGGYYYYKNFYNNPKKVFEYVCEAIEKKLNNDKKELKNIEINGLINFDLDLGMEYQETTDIINNLSLQFNSQIDYSNNISISNINTKYKEQKLINFKTFSDNDNFYFYLEDLFDKYIKIDKKQIIDTKELDKNKDSINIIMEEILMVLKNKLSNLEFIRTDDTILINNQKYDVNNNYIKLKNGEINNFLLDILNDLSNNKKFINVLDKISDDEGKEIIDDLKKDIRNDTIIATYQLSFYTKKNLHQDLISIRQFIDTQDEHNVMEVNIVKENDLNLKMYDEASSIELNFTTKDNAFNIDFTINASNQKMSMTANFNYKEISSIQKFDISNYIDINDLSEEDYNLIGENLGNNERLLEIYEEIENIEESIT